MLRRFLGVLARVSAALRRALALPLLVLVYLLVIPWVWLLRRRPGRGWRRRDDPTVASLARLRAPF